ncbi:hypothetical protein CNEO4_2660003 [Clostridium neonatale]|nr:hypothetical protein CNEO_1630003 [Clostridium neonatale]CAI3546881.1 hypothetical protein CNEO2_1660003 [Clostridium neonatale]CAI3551310.1 hypothetical protein CNEO3_1300003 [Clostridium neonatale]CAI3569195.1 hypothetical protein CNEO3_1460004 [Clostridium neonatale]CAI3576628.1 hypothetical protein CNEO3_1550003 [Clostridium neonatale]
MRLMITAKLVLNLIDTYINNGICHEDKINKSIDAKKLFFIGIVDLNKYPIIVTSKKNIKHVIPK